MKNMKKVLCLAALLAMVLTMGACGKKDFDAQGYVKSVLDANYHGEYTEYAEFRGIGVEEAKTEVEETLRENIGVNSFEGTEEEKQQFYDDMMKCYALTKYEVGEAVKGDDGKFTVPVTFEPISAAVEFQDGMEAYMMENLDSITEENYMSHIMTFFEQCIENNTYGEKVTQEVHVQLSDDEQYYEMPEDDILALESAMLQL